VQWIIQRDKKAMFKYAPLQSEAAQNLLAYHTIPEDLDSVLYLRGEDVYSRSSAVLYILKDLGGLYAVGVIFFIIPRFLRDAIYRFIAKNRYRWFGKKESCMIPRPEWSDRFI